MRQVITPAGRLSRKLLSTAALALAAAVPANAAFTINLVFSDTTTVQQQQAFINAKAYWESMITGYSTTGGLSGITINADVSFIDGAGGTLGQAGPDANSLVTQGGKVYTTTGSMQFDSEDVKSMISNNSFGDVIRHEMGHVLGIGTLWTENGLRELNNETTSGNPARPGAGYFNYVGKNALAAWQIEFDRRFASSVPIEKEGGDGTWGAHWDEMVGGSSSTGNVSIFRGADFKYEMMTGWANVPVFTSNVTVGGIVDLGYTIAGPTATNGVYNFDRTYLTTPEANINDYNLGRVGRYGTMVWGKLTGDSSVVVNVDSDAVVAIMAANDYTGGTTVTSGKLIVGNELALGTGGITVNGGTLDLNDFDITATSLTMTGGVIGTTLYGSVFTFASGSITVTGPTMDLRAGEIAADLKGGATLNKTGPGTLTLSGFSNSYTGGTNIDGGTLITKSSSALGNGPVSISNGSTLLLGSSLFVFDTVTLNDGLIGFVPLDPTDTNATLPTLSAFSFDLKSGTVSAIIGFGDVTKTGSGTVTLSGANTFSQGTTVLDGRLVLANTSALGSGDTTVSGAGAVLDVGATNVVTAGDLILNSGSIVGSTGSLAAASFTLNDGVVSAALAGAGSVTKGTAGTVTLSGANTFTGGLTVSDGTLIGAAAGTLGAGAVNLNGGTLSLTHSQAAANAGVALNGGVLNFGALTEAALGSIEGVGNFDLGAVALTVGGNNLSKTYSGVISGSGSLRKVGTGELILFGTSTYTGETRVSDGTLTLGVANALGGGAVTVDGGTLNIGALAVSVGSIVLDGGTIAGTTGTLDAATYDLRAGTVGVKLVGGSVTKSGPGDITLSLTNTYTGGTTVTGGRLIVGAVGALSNGTVTVRTDATLDIGAYTMSGMAGLTVEGGTVTGTSGAFISLTDVQAKSGLIAARLQGSAGLIKTTTDTVTLSGSNGFLGGVAVNEGLLVITHTGALGTGATSVADGATLRIGDGTTAFGTSWTGNAIALNNGTLELGLTSTTTISRALSGTGGVVQNGTGTVTLSNASYTGATVVNSGRLVLPVARLDLTPGALSANGSGTLAIAGNGSTVNFSRAVTGDGVLAFTGNGTTRLANGTSLAFTGALDIESGQKFSLGAASGENASVAARLVAIRSGARLSGAGNIAGSLYNAGTLTPGFSPGTITLGGDFTNTGTLTMETDGSTGDHDQIRYAGQAVLGGTLNLVYLNGAPAKGAIIDLLVDTDTSDGRPSIVGNFASIILPTGGGIAYNTGDGINFLVGGTLFDIPGSNISPRLISMTQAIASASNPAVANALNPIVLPVSSLAGGLMAASPLALSSAMALPVAEALNGGDELRRHLDGRRFERVTSTDLGWSPYISGNGSTVTSKTGADNAVFNYRTFGGLVGLDKGIGDGFTLGTSVAYDSGHATFHGGAGKLDQDHARVTVYGSKLIASKYYVDAGVFGGASLYDTKRNTPLGTQTGDMTGWDAGVFTDAGFIAPVTSTISATPHLGFSYAHANASAFNESGSDLALKVSEMNYDSLSVRIGSGLNARTSLGDMPLRFGFDVSFVHELLDNEVDIDASFASSPGSGFTASAVVMPKDRLEVGPELDWQVGEGQSVTASYKYQYAFGEGAGHRVDVGFRTRF